jgi:hypothetical protein
MPCHKGNITIAESRERETFVCFRSSSAATLSRYVLVPEGDMDLLEGMGSKSGISPESLMHVLLRCVKYEACGRFRLLNPEDGSTSGEYMPVHADYSGRARFFYSMESR